MPLSVKYNVEPDGFIAIWDIEESDDFFLERLTLSKDEATYVEKLKAKRKTEWLASRYTLQMMFPKQELQLVKDPYGKPWIKDSDLYISLSHSHDKTAVICSSKVVGIDIQKRVEKISRIAKKFINSSEKAFIHESDSYISNLHVVWGCKESIFKAYGKKELDFRRNMVVDPFVINTNEPFSFEARLTKDDLQMNFKMTASLHQNYYLCYAIED